MRHLVIENLDSCFDRFRTEFTDILNEFNVFNDQADVPTQTIVTARRWHPALNLFFKCPSNPILCIGAYIEAAVYGHTKISLSLVCQEKKFFQTLCKCTGYPCVINVNLQYYFHFSAYIKKLNYLAERTIVVCNKPNEANELADFLRRSSILHCVFNDETSTEEKECKNNQFGNMFGSNIFYFTFYFGV